MNVAVSIAEYAQVVDFNDLGSKTAGTVKTAVADTMGCAIGASSEGPVAIARKLAENVSAEYGASLLGTGHRTDPSYAAFVNGFAARYFDYNDSYESKEFAHPSDNIFPMIAVAEAERRGGKDLMLAIALAYELQCRLCDAGTLWRRGWDHVNYGLVSVAAGAARLMRLSADKTEQAINLALNSHITMRQVREGELSMLKGASFSNAARNAVFCAMLAKGGMTGPSPIFEGKMGFEKLVSGPMRIDASKFTRRGDGFLINKRITKFFPAEIRSQSAISAASRLHGRIGVIENVKGVTIRTTESGYKILGKDPEKWKPKTKETADHSLPFVVAVALMDGTVSNGSYSQKRLRDGKTLALVAKTRVLEDKGFTRAYPKYIANSVEVTMKDGKTFKETTLYQKGHPRNPLSAEEQRRKFMALAGAFLGNGKADALLGRISDMEGIKNIREIMPIYKIAGWNR